MRDAGNHGLHVNKDVDPNFVMLTEQVPQGDLAYVPDYMPGYHGGVVGNGYHRYAPDLAHDQLAQGALVYDNLASGNATAATPALHVKTPGKPGIAILEMNSPYVYLGGRIKINAIARSRQDKVTISLSTNNGRTFAPLWSSDKTGAGNHDRSGRARHRAATPTS